MNNHDINFPPLREPNMEEIQACWEAIRRESPKPKHIPRSMPEWMRAEGYCNITRGDDAYSKAGHEIH